MGTIPGFARAPAQLARESSLLPASSRSLRWEDALSGTRRRLMNGNGLGGLLAEGGDLAGEGLGLGFGGGEGALGLAAAELAGDKLIGARLGGG